MKKFSIYFLFILSIYPVMAFGQQPPNGTGEIYGTVFQKDLEQRVASAQIRIAGTNQRVTTDPNGEFRFRDLPAGKYTLTASASDYRLLTDIAVTVEPGETTELKIYLERVTVLLDEVEVTGERAATAVGRQTLGVQRFSASPVPLEMPCVHYKPCPVSVSRTTLAVPSISAAAPMKTTYTTLTGCRSDIPTILAESSRPSVPKSLSGSMSTPAATVPNLVSILRQ